MDRPLRYLASLLVIALAVHSRAQVVLNEVSASDLTSYPDNYGNYEDWAELYNTSGAVVDISGWHMSDDPATPLMWAFPAGTTIAANGHLMVFCSGRNISGGGFYHTNFKVNQTAQEHVVLADVGGTVLDDFQFTLRTKADNSRGRTTDGAATWSLFTAPTPNAANAGASAEYTQRPVLSPQAGFYAGAQNVSITGPAGASIRYTVDGSEPTAASTLYAGPIAVASTTVIRAACFAAGQPSSFSETNSYFINDAHSVAVISVAGDQVDDLLNGNGGLQPLGSFEYFGPDQALRDEAVGEFNEHGNDSWAYAQRGFDYITRDQTGYNDGIHYPVFRTKPERHNYQRLILKAAANDNYPFEGGGAHIRDSYVQALSQMAGLHLDERSYEPCVVYVNGQYWGVYDMREKVDDSDFTRKYYDQDENNVQMLQTWGGTWSAYGGAAAQNDWDALKAYIMGNNMGDPVAFAYVDGQFNYKSLVDYVILNSYVVCSDWLNWNTMWWRGLNPSGEHKKWGYCLWDEDATFGHYINYTGVPTTDPTADPCNPEQLNDPGGQGHIPILTKLINENPTVRDYYVNRYIDLTNTVFQCAHMESFLDSLINLIQPEMTRHCTRWGGTVAEWQQNVQTMRDYMTARCADITTGMVDCYDVTGPFPVTFKVEPPLSGDIRINSIIPPAYPFTGNYYGGITTSLQAISASGWSFDHWEATNHTLTPSMTDSLGTLEFTTSDTIIAHFRPPVSIDVVLMTDPMDKATIEFNGLSYSTFPVTVGVAEAVPIPMTVAPNEFYDFLYWEVKHNIPSTNDSTLRSMSVTFYEGDTIIAHLKPQEYGYWAPNAFTPNGDLVNDQWQPWGNVIELSTFDLEVYDRWGQVVWHANDPHMSWDGSAGGQPVPIGVYAFRGKAIEGITKEKHELAGFVCVIR